MRIRNILSEFIDRVSKSEIQLMLSTNEGRAGFRKTLGDLGHSMTDKEFDTLVQSGLHGHYDVDYEQTWHVQEMLKMGLTLAPILSQRKWQLWKADVGAPDLICSDSPVSPTWATPPPPGPISPAFGTPNTIVSVPLNRRLALVGMLEIDLPEQDLDRIGVAAVNSMTTMYANQLYSPEPDFVWTMQDDQIGDAADMLKALRNAGQP